MKHSAPSLGSAGDLRQMGERQLRQPALRTQRHSFSSCPGNLNQCSYSKCLKQGPGGNTSQKHKISGTIAPPPANKNNSKNAETMGLSGIHFISFLTSVDSLGIAQNPFLAISLLKAAQSNQGSVERTGTALNRSCCKPGGSSLVLFTRPQG